MHVPHAYTMIWYYQHCGLYTLSANPTLECTTYLKGSQQLSYAAFMIPAIVLGILQGGVRKPVGICVLVFVRVLRGPGLTGESVCCHYYVPSILCLSFNDCKIIKIDLPFLVTYLCALWWYMLHLQKFASYMNIFTSHSKQITIV